ncbi:WASH complex subunit 2 isoform X1 [Procambarus clarkii]|uniref:WASH complex subunit 2 isoform X1 n=1 Tax=Procambarus clarkii TaxID=6728 RepID=UPI00374415CA
MGSTEESGGTGERWWESTKLSPADLRPHAESWNLAADAATATLLQSISQRLVLRTHEVEGTLKKVLEETDRVMTTISNTNNAFHMLANTQFIENRTYQDDADLVKEKSNMVEKTAVGEEDVITRCKQAIADGLHLVDRSYERHEIQDSDSDDEDSPGSPVPVYALIDPYESKPLPLIIGSEGFMADDKVGLQEISSSEENSKLTFSPDETESEDDLDMEDETSNGPTKYKPILASSSKVIDDESDSDWSDDDTSHPVNSLPTTDKRKPQAVTSEEENDEDLFSPPSKASQRLVNNGTVISSQIGKKLSNSAATANASRGGLYSDSDEDGDLFGQQQDPSNSSGGLFGNTQLPPATRAGNTNYLFGESNTHSPSDSVKSSVGVENVRAMPDPIRPGPPAVSRPRKNGGNLFASDSDDEEENLFSSKPQSTAKSRTSGGKVKSQADQSSTTAGSLFSSDEDGGLFSTSQQTQGAVYSKEDHEEEEEEEPPPLPKQGRTKVPVGGINIFGSAITSAIRRQQSSESDPSDEEWSNKGSSRGSLASATKPETTSSQGSVPKPVNVGKYSGGGGLFDDDDDDDLFGSTSKKTNTSTHDAINSQKRLISDSPKNPKDGNNLFGKEPADKCEGKNNTIKSSGGLFSDDDDDLFGGPVYVEKKQSTIAPAAEESTSSNVLKNNSVISPLEDVEQLSSVKPTASQNNQKTSPVKVPETSKALSSSLFSSLSDEDDLFSPSSTSVTAKASSFVTEPPPLPSADANKSTNRISGSPIIQDDPFSCAPPVSPASKTRESPARDSASSHDKPAILNADQKTQLPLSNSLFSSSEDDLFSSSSNTTHEVATVIPENKSQEDSLESKEDQTKSGSIIPDVTTATKTKKSEANLGIFGSPEDDLFIPKSKVSDNLIKEGMKYSISPDSHIPTDKSDFLASLDNDDDEDIFSDVPKPLLNNKIIPESDRKITSFLGSDDEEDIFSVTPKGTRSNDSPKLKIYEDVVDEKDIFNTLSQSQHQTDLHTTITKIVNTAEESTKTTASVVERESPPSVSTGTEDSLSPRASESKQSPDTAKPVSAAPKRPVGGIALFGGAELFAKINKRKSLLSTGVENGEDVQVESNKIEHKIERTNEDQKDNLNKNSIFAGESDDDLFGTSQDKSELSSSTLLNEESAPTLLAESEGSSYVPSENPEMLSPSQDIFQSANVTLSGENKNMPGKSELNLNESGQAEDAGKRTHKKIEIRSEKIEQCLSEEQGNQEIKPKKKPPIGGVSMFGGGGFGGKELFAKVQQRKSMLAPESESSDDEPLTSPPQMSLHTKRISIGSRKTVSPTSSVSPISPMSPLSPLSPMSPMSPVFSSGQKLPKTGGEESSVSFDEPATSTTTLQSINKSRARGSQKRRPPSRAHRRTGLEENNSSDTSTNLQIRDSSEPSETFASHAQEHLPEPIVVSQVQQTNYSPVIQGPLEISKNERLGVEASASLTDNINGVDSIFSDSSQDDIFGNSGVIEAKNHSVSSEKAPIITTREAELNIAPKKTEDEKDDDDDDDDDDLFGKSRSALNVSKIKSTKKEARNSLFGGSDSDDEDLFGEAKVKTSLSKTSRSAAVHTSVIKSMTKPLPTQSLFRDDYGDKLSVTSRADKASIVASRKVSKSISKSNLQPSDEPFDDPLLSNFKG